MRKTLSWYITIFVDPSVDTSMLKPHSWLCHVRILVIVVDLWVPFEAGIDPRIDLTFGYLPSIDCKFTQQFLNCRLRVSGSSKRPSSAIKVSGISFIREGLVT